MRSRLLLNTKSCFVKFCDTTKFLRCYHKTLSALRELHPHKSLLHPLQTRFAFTSERQFPAEFSGTPICPPPVPLVSSPLKGCRTDPRPLYEIPRHIHSYNVSVSSIWTSSSPFIRVYPLAQCFPQLFNSRLIFRKRTSPSGSRLSPPRFCTVLPYLILFSNVNVKGHSPITSMACKFNK